MKKKTIYFGFICIMVALLSFVSVNGSERALGVRTITHSDTLYFNDVNGTQRSVNYTLVFTINSDTNGRYTSHKYKSISFGSSSYATFTYNSLQLLSTNSTGSLVNLRLNVNCKLKNSTITRTASDDFSYSTYGPYSLR